MESLSAILKFLCVCAPFKHKTRKGLNVSQQERPRTVRL
ncbi:Uncharacterised protein [Vibrio cholerae]|nr:Uncharacterised protein [Vibrio cholerae]